MIPTNRPIDIAMAEDRPEKRTVRALWIENLKIVAQRYPNSNVPWYLTLSGAEGRDIQLMIDNGLIRLTEVNSIAEEFLDKVVAVEYNNSAVASLTKKFVGLRIKEVNFTSLVRGTNLLAWPDGEDVKFCRAHVVNLDLDGALTAVTAEGQVIFPIIEWIRKLCLIHSTPQHVNWTLFLTLHAEAQWSAEGNKFIKDFLSENMAREPRFATSCEGFLGIELFRQIITPGSMDFSSLIRLDQQKIIMVSVPKIIARLVHDHGWEVHTNHNLCYGNMPNAPMDTWILNFVWNGQATAQPDLVYKFSICKILEHTGAISVDGTINHC